MFNSRRDRRMPLDLEDLEGRNLLSALNPQPLPPGHLVDLNPQPLPPRHLVDLNPQPLPPGRSHF